MTGQPPEVDPEGMDEALERLLTEADKGQTLEDLWDELKASKAKGTDAYVRSLLALVESGLDPEKDLAWMIQTLLQQDASLAQDRVLLDIPEDELEELTARGVGRVHWSGLQVWAEGSAVLCPAPNVTALLNLWSERQK